MALPKLLTTGRQPLLLAAVSGENFTRKILKIEIPRQEANNWCWAAVAVGIGKAYGDIGLKQCRVATMMLADRQPPLQCCSGESAGDCDVPMSLNQVLSLPDHDHLDGPVLPVKDFDFIKEEIDNGHPIAVGIQRLSTDDPPKPAGGHFSVITGYLLVNGNGTGPKQFVYFDDPIASRGVRPLASFHVRSDGEWVRTYKTKGDRRVRFRVEIPKPKSMEG